MINENPKDVSTSEEKTIEFSVSAAGSNLIYNWEYSTNDGYTWKALSTKSFPTASTADLSLKAKQSFDGYLFRCKVISGETIKYSNSAKLTVISAG